MEATSDIVITESRPSELLQGLHDRATPELEHLFANRAAEPSDLVLVAWAADEAVGYLVATDGGEGAIDVWEHAVAPAQRQRGVGRTLLYELAKRIPMESTVRIDPVHQLDVERIADYYARCGFAHDPIGQELSAVATAIVRATGRSLTGPRGDPVRVLLAAKSSDVITIAPSATVDALVALFERHRIGAVPVSRDGLRIEGIVSERDVLSHLARRGTEMLQAPVEQIMTVDVVTCTADDGIELIMSLMTRLRIRHVPVVADGHLDAMLSIGDIVRYRLEQLERENEHIREYIVTGR